jgi:hypothetical protein
VVTKVLECSLNPIESPRGILPGKSNNGIDDFLSDSWPTWFTFIAEIELLRDEISMPSQDRVWCNDGCQLEQSLEADGMSSHGKYTTLVVVEPQAFFFGVAPAGPRSVRSGIR